MTLRAAAGLLMFQAAHGTCWPQAATTHPPRSWMNASLSPDGPFLLLHLIRARLPFSLESLVQ